ncbi:hypothetical protein M878_20840 [Streptomyces roseochromogenus subsp. oscitans DS 12.976]|uniref:Response regulatory domain-containing protein n=1 Tax=Streptomyces roseochromogenus subsp. oscitans DS 12.976 TaxID=1352936 RepID=V6KCS6_STRRC|nr:hypothetical protein M878_20840 [Streptomyces roseochromogenus subsp. oscitans DS 12.976]
MLLADADHTFRKMRSQLLALEDDLDIVAEVASGAEVLGLAQLHAPDVTVLTSPLPGCDELALATELRAQVPSCAVVILGSSEGASLSDALAAGAQAMLLKEAPGQRLIRAIRAVHAGHRYVDQESVADAVTRDNRATS